MPLGRKKGQKKERRIEAEKVISQKKLRDRRKEERDKGMDEIRSQTQNLDSETTRGPLAPSIHGSTASSTGREGPHSKSGPTIAGARKEHSFNSNDSGPFFGYTSNRMPIFPNFNPS